MYAYIPDILLLLVSGITCLYCLILSRRLKKLQSLEGGLGGSIVELTQTIAKTSEAASQARRATEENIAVLRKLLHEAQDTTPQIEAQIESLRYSKTAAQTAHAELEKILASKIKPGLQNARQASQSLLQIVREVSDFQRRPKNLKTPDIIKHTHNTNRERAA